jgi:hypothetical protein
MIPLRRFSPRVLVVQALIIMAGSEFVNSLLITASGHDITWLQQRLAWTTFAPESDVAKPLTGSLGWFAGTIPFFTPGVIFRFGTLNFIMLYPLMPWLAVMLLGWVFGRYLIHLHSTSLAVWHAERLLTWCGIGTLGFFILVRGFNDYGNMFLLRDDNTLTQWLNVCKYPPGLSFYALELGIMALCLAAFMRFRRTVSNPIRSWNPALVFGQTALFFYLLHLHILLIGKIVTAILGIPTEFGLPGTYLVTCLDLIILYPLCLWYRQYKQSHRHNWTRYI